VVVIGAGHNGLICAIRLARAGEDVLVLESAERPGGGVHSERGVGGIVHDVCSGFFPLARASPAVRELPLERHGLEWLAPPVAMAHPFGDGSAIALHRDLAETAASLDRVAPGAGAAWAAAVGPLVETGRLFPEAALARFPPVRAGGALALRLRREAPELVRRMLMAPADLGRELGADDRVAAWLSGTALHSDLGPDDAGGSAFTLLLHVLGHQVGWPIVRGGAQRLTDALVAHLRELGGELRCGAAVTRIESDTRVRGVTAGGERLEARAVVATLSARALAPLLADDALPGRLMTRLRGWSHRLGTLKVDFALREPVPWLSEVARRAAVVHVGDTLDALRAEGCVICGQHTLFDPSRAPAGGHNLYAYRRCPPHVDDPPAFADRIEERIEALAPGFRALVTEREVRSPERIEAENPSFVCGDLAGGSAKLDQQLIFRPAPELFRYRSPLRGLYVAGASTHPGPGVHGASGAGAADALLADRSPLRFWR
jgi:phytoene dehydrogenase-like protein